MVRTESGKSGQAGDFNFLATNSKPQIAKTNRESDKRGVCMFSKPKSEPSCKVVQKTTAAVTTTTAVLLYLNGFWQPELDKPAKCNKNNNINRCRYKYRYGYRNRTPTASESASETNLERG